MKKIRIIFCGVCNPYIDPTKIINLINEKHRISFAFLEDKPIEKNEILILFNSCPRQCLNKYDYKINNKRIINTSKYTSLFESGEKVIANKILEDIEEISL